MQPTLLAGDRVLVWRSGRIRPGDLVVARLPERGVGVKRAVARTDSGWLVHGDNTTASTDSRQFGPVADGAVLGRVVWRYWPLRRSSARATHSA
jgi:nickel-type superoxide dismutase maturation protease